MTDASPAPSVLESTALAPGSVFGQYRVVRCIGTGGMGAVFEGFHEMLSRRVAIKVMHGRHAERDDARERFLREARAVAKIRHPHVVDVFDVGLLDDQPFLVMEYLEGESLESAMDRVGKMDARQAVAVLLPIAAALAAVHRHGLVHRDVKPENIFLARDARGHVVPKLVDFGIAKDLTVAFTGDHHTVVGTPHFMSPEQARGSLALDGRTDQYAFGVLAYELLTGQLPYDAASLLELVRAIDAGNVVPLRSLDPSIDPGLEAIVLRAMARDIEKRHADMREVGQAMLRFASPRLASSLANDFGTVTGPHDGTDPISGVMTRPRSTETTLDELVGPDSPVVGVPVVAAESIRDPIVARSSSNRSRIAVGIAAMSIALLAAFAFLDSRESSPATRTVTVSTPAPAIAAPAPPPTNDIGASLETPTVAEAPEATSVAAEESNMRARRASSARPRASSGAPARPTTAPVQIRLER